VESQAYAEKYSDAIQKTLVQELQGIHKLIAEYEALLDLLSAKCENVMLPANPTPSANGGDIAHQRSSPMREEIHVLINRLKEQNERLDNYQRRLDV
jgi:hypothetical protein